MHIELISIRVNRNILGILYAHLLIRLTSKKGIFLIPFRYMDETNQMYSAHLCATCGGPAPDWKCPACGFKTTDFDPLHFQKCVEGKMQQAECQKCEEAETNCTCAQKEY